MSRIIKRNSRIAELVLLSLLFCFSLFSCTIRQEGCLEVGAQNFDLDADRNCDGCCLYPPLSISLSQKWDDRNFSIDSILIDSANRQYRIRDLRYVLSSFAWSDADMIYTIDSIDVECAEQTVQYTPDIIIVDTRKFLYLLDSIQEFPFIREIMFKLGWLPVLSCVDESDETLPDEFSNSSPLWDSTANARAAIRLVVQRDLTMESFDTLFIHTCQQFSIPYELEFIQGKETRLNLTVNYALWFMDVDISDAGSFQSSILSNLSGSISRTP